MDNKQQRVLQALRRVQTWCAANPALVPAPVPPSDAWSPLTRQLDTLNTLIAQATAAATEQGVQTTRATLAASGELSLRQHLRAEMHAVAQVARALRKTVPGISTLKMPAWSTSVENLLAAADAQSKQATTYEAVLVEHGLAPDFLAQLASAASAVRASLDARGVSRASASSATKQVKVSLALGQQYVQIMDAALTKVLRKDPARLAEWNHTRRVVLKGTNHVEDVIDTPTTLLESVPAVTDSKAA